LAEDAFEAVAITWSRPEAAVILSMFEFYGIPAYATGRWHSSISPPHITALQRIQVRVHPDALGEARELLAEVAERPGAVRPFLIGNAATGIAMFIVALLLAILIPFPFSLVGMTYIQLLLIAVPPTRTPSTFLFGNH
jgi:hypothetical protein